MIAQTPREQLLHELEHLDDAQIMHILNIIRLWDAGEAQVNAYDESRDALIGFLKISPDLSNRAAAILSREFGNKSQPEASKS